MQRDLFQSGHDLELRATFQNDILRSKYSTFDASRQEERTALGQVGDGLFLPQTFESRDVLKFPHRLTMER